jgi:hypothetical protein
VESLHPKLEALFSLEIDREFSACARQVCLVAANTIAQLGELDLIQYEDSDFEASADLSMWETVAPIIGSTISEMHVLTAQIESSFPVGEFARGGRPTQVATLIRSAAAELKAEVMNFGRHIRDPAIVGDRWNLIAELQAVRFRFRDRIGKLVWDVAAAFGECKRREVEPGYEQALAATLVVRAMTADLRRLMRARIQKVAESGAGDVLSQAQQIEKELNAFGRTAAWRSLRSQDKKGILEFRFKLRQCIAEGSPSKIEVLGALEPFVDFVEGFNGISRREFLVQHDQEVLASVGVALERAMNVDSYEERLAAFKDALDAGQTLYGRSIEFDVFLRAQRKGLPKRDVIESQLDQFLMQIVGLSQY